jgi:hypothetical protein
MKREHSERIIKILFPSLKYEIDHYEILHRQSMDENFNWVEDTPAIFIGIKFLDENEVYNNQNISEIVSQYTGREYNIYKT